MASLWYGKALAEVWSRGKQLLLHQFQEEPDCKQAYLESMHYVAACKKTYFILRPRTGSLVFPDYVLISSQVYANLISVNYQLPHWLIFILTGVEVFLRCLCVHASTVYLAHTSVQFEVIEDTIKYHESCSQKVLPAVQNLNKLQKMHSVKW